MGIRLGSLHCPLVIPVDPMPYPLRWRTARDDPGSDEMPACVCGCDVHDHAEAPEMPCLTCRCESYREDEQ